MSDDNSKSSPAVAIAQRAFWIAVSGGLLGIVCRVDVINQRLRALLMLLAIALMMVAGAFGLLALVRSNSTNRKAVVIPALSGLLLGLAMLANLSYWGRDQWVKARLQASQRGESSQTTPTPSVATLPRAKTVKSIVPYELPALDQIPETVATVKAQAQRSKGEDAAVLRAWAGHLQKLHTAGTNTLSAYQRLHEVDLLNAKLISKLNQDEVVRRRSLANQYSDAWRQLSEELSTFAGSYYEDLRQQRVSGERASSEVQSLSAFLEQPDTAAQIASVRKLCKAEEEVGRHYNYAASAVFDYALIANRVPNPPPSIRQQMDQNISQLRKAERVASQARKEASATP